MCIRDRAYIERPVPGCAQRIRELSSQCTVFSTFDLTKGYYQLPMHPECRHYFAITCHLGTFVPTRLPMGDSNAVGYFHNAIGAIIGDVNGLVHYIDDVVIASVSHEEHLADIEDFFKICKKHRLLLKPTKSFVGYPEITSMGASISAEGYRPKEGIAAKVEAWKFPQSPKDMRSFLGLAN